MYEKEPLHESFCDSETLVCDKPCDELLFVMHSRVAGLLTKCWCD
jgi:hypothetical protein